MEYESPYIIIKQSKKEDVITLSLDTEKPETGDGAGAHFSRKMLRMCS